MKKLSKFQFILLSSIVLIVMIISGAFLIKLIQLFLTSLLLLFASFYLLNKSPFSKKVSLLIIFLPILLIYGWAYIYDLIYDEGFIGKPFFWSYLLIVVLIYLNDTYISKKKIIAFFTPFCFLLTAYVYYSSTENEKNKIEISQLKSVVFLDETGKKVALDSFQGKLILFEFWTTSCGQCPESIANFQYLSNQYKSNNNIDFKVVNINLGKRHNQKIFDKIESDIRLKKLYTSEEIFDQLNFNAAPAILVLNENGEIIYFGYPNFKKLTQNYLPNIIEKELIKM